MLPRELLREQPARVAERLRARGVAPGALERWQELDSRRRALLQQVEEWKRQRNEASKEIGQKKREGGSADEQIRAVATLKGEIDRLEGEVGKVDEDLRGVELGLPNLPHESVPVGQDEGANRLERVVGQPPELSFEPKPHWELGAALGILDFERGVKLAGARFVAYFGLGARLERALASLMLDLHTGKHGYTEVLPPLLANEASLLGTGQLPKFEKDLFRVDAQGLYLIPTAEVPLVNLHRDEILDEARLPLLYTAWTPCFRSEAGSHGQDVRGLIRLHQFSKVELVQITTPEASYQALEEIVSHAEAVLGALGLAYRVITLSTGDMNFGSAKTHDLEVWLPGQGRYREISSCSNCEDFQARRSNLRYRTELGKPRFAHTLNGSALAVGRTLVAVLENYQLGDGSVVVPEALRPYLGGLERLVPPGGA